MIASRNEITPSDPGVAIKAASDDVSASPLSTSLMVLTVIVDVGGNVGAAAIWFHHRYPNARIISYEPSQLIFGFLSENLRDLNNVEAVNLGLFDDDREVTLHIGLHHVAETSIVAHEETGSDTESIALARASRIFEELGETEISILKLDTEGCEVPILTDLRGWFDRIGAIYVEYHSDDARRQIDQMLAEHFYLIRATIQRANMGTLVYLCKSVASRHRSVFTPPLDSR